MINQRNYALLFFLVVCGFLFSLKPTYASDIDGRYRDNGNGTITDNKTNLTWMRCSLGQSWDGKTCSGEAKKYIWNDATKLTHQFAGSTAWRLPTVEELDSLVYCSKGRRPSARPNSEYVKDTNGVCLGDNYQEPTINITAFPNTPDFWYWSSSPDAYYSRYAWGVGFRTGLVGVSYLSDDHHVRLVRAESNPSTPKPAFSSSEQKEPPETVNKYVVNPNGTVYDKETNLTWMRCSLGQSWDGKTCTGEAKKYTWYDATKLTYQFAGSTAWRVPTVEELDSLVYCSKGRKPAARPNGKYVKDTDGECLGDNYQKPTINISAFPRTPDSWYWSSSPYAYSGYGAWVVGFYDGYVGSNVKNYGYHVRLVRAGQ
ncbi:Lcl C-terminal domain-containing protein [Vibrio cholerae]|uniref:Lcl C-terminal domain-containing protein n=1 Tax=Vibrio cholerae TaxID=666 RepID=UPI001F22FF31|nr:DUF1566 domain-containing protein [Vibrio cholerae]